MRQLLVSGRNGRTVEGQSGPVTPCASSQSRRRFIYERTNKGETQGPYLGPGAPVRSQKIIRVYSRSFVVKHFPRFSSGFGLFHGQHLFFPFFGGRTAFVLPPMR